MKINTNTPKIAFVSLGCPKNQCDAELMLAKIAKAGYALVPEPGLADVVIVNTCCFIQSAQEESIEEIFEAVTRRKEGGGNKKIIVTGCMSERYRQQLADEIPEIDAVISLADNDKIAEVIAELLADDDKRVLAFSDICGHNMEGERLLSTLPHYAYLRIADGCDNRCAYCAIPLFRGGFRSRKPTDVLQEARELAQNGVKELILVAQDVTNYGADLGGEYSLAKLLTELAQIDSLRRIRLLYCYPQRITDELIRVIATHDKIAKYLDIPIQHCNGEILQKMNRQGVPLKELIAKLRREIPGLVLRTTLLVGFPGETPEQFTELAEFAHEMRFEHLGCFAYSQEEGTPAAEMPDQIDEDEKQRRREIIMEQQEIRAAEFLEGLVGDVFEVVAEGYDKHLALTDDPSNEGDAGLYFGRTYMQAPEIDGMVYFSAAETLRTGDFVQVRIEQVVDNNLVGIAVKENAL